MVNHGNSPWRVAPQGPQRIVCLTEETTEWLYLLGEEARIVGISGYTVRPKRARAEKPRVSAFLSAKIDKILALKPDCVFGFSDLQADIAAELIRAGDGVQPAQRGRDSVDDDAGGGHGRAGRARSGFAGRHLPWP
jgi:iron complex transport system substrate-binding protein